MKSVWLSRIWRGLLAAIISGIRYPESNVFTEFSLQAIEQVWDTDCDAPSPL